MSSPAFHRLGIAALLCAAAVAPACNHLPAEPPCGGALPFERYPASHLAAVWRKPGGAPLAIAGRLLARNATLGYSEIDPATGEALRTVSTSSSFSWMPEASRGDLWIGSDETPYVRAIDPATLTERWAVACNPGNYRCIVEGARAGSVAVFAGVLDYENVSGSIGVFAVNTYSGKEMWRTPVFSGDSSGLKLAADTEHAFVTDAMTLRVYDVPRGTLLWSRALTNKMSYIRRTTPIAAEQGTVALWEGGDDSHILVLDADSGDEQARIPWPRMVGDMVLEGGVLYVTSNWDGDGMAVAAFEAHTGAEKWHAGAKGHWPLPPMEMSEDTIFILSSRDSTLALNERGTEIIGIDKERGEQVFIHQVGQVRQIALLPGGPGGSVLAFEAPTGELIGMQRTAAGPAPVEAEVSGTLSFSPDSGIRSAASLPATGEAASETFDLKGLRVEVGDSVVKTDEQGRFSARVSALGAVRVRLVDIPVARSNPPLRSEPVLFYLGGEGVAGAAKRLSASLVIERVSPWPRD